MQKAQKIYAVWTYVKDAEKSKRFYEHVLGVKPRFEDNGWIEFNIGETTFAILERPLAKGGFKPQKTRIMFQVADIAAKEKELRTQSVEIVNKMVEAYGTILTFEDLDGNWLEFYEPRSYDPTQKEGVTAKLNEIYSGVDNKVDSSLADIQLKSLVKFSLTTFIFSEARYLSLSATSIW